MIAIEVFRKKKKMEPILQKCWPVVSERLVYPQVVDRDPPQKLVFFGLMTYATVYEAASAAGMSSSAAHYLARMQLGKCRLGEAVEKVVESTFSGFDSEEEQAYADLFHDTIARVIEKITADETELDAELQKLADGFRPVPLVARQP